MILRGKWGLNLAEIGYCFGLTESRISQRYSAIQGRLSKKVEAAERRALPKMGQWIQKTETERRPALPGPREPEMARLLCEEEGVGPGLEFEADRLVAEIEPWEMALPDEACLGFGIASEMV